MHWGCTKRTLSPDLAAPGWPGPMGSAKGGDGEWRWRRHGGGAAAVHPPGAALAGDRSGRDQSPPDWPGRAVDATGATGALPGGWARRELGRPKAGKVLASCAEWVVRSLLGRLRNPGKLCLPRVSAVMPDLGKRRRLLR
jgi:hypothetical protein